MALFEQLAVKYITDLVRDFDLKAFQAAGFPGNAGVESGGFTQLQEVNPTSGRGGLGHFQDTGPRRIAFEAWLAKNADKNWSAGDYAANYSFLFRELEGDEKRVLTPLRASTTVEEATDIVMRVFERPAPATAHLEKRQDYARRALAAFQASGIDEEVLRTQPRPGAPQGAQEVLDPLKPHPAGADVAQVLQTVLPQILTALMPMLQQMVATRQQSAPTDPLLPIIAELLKAKTPPPPEPAPAAPPKTGLALSLGGLFASFGAMATGHLGTPLGMGTEPTTAGNLVPLAFGAAAAIASTGAFGPVGAALGRAYKAIRP